MHMLMHRLRFAPRAVCKLYHHQHEVFAVYESSR
jgi:hypothetical protein